MPFAPKNQDRSGEILFQGLSGMGEGLSRGLAKLTERQQQLADEDKKRARVTQAARTLFVELGLGTKEQAEILSGPEVTGKLEAETIKRAERQKALDNIAAARRDEALLADYERRRQRDERAVKAEEMFRNEITALAQRPSRIAAAAFSPEMLARETLNPDAFREMLDNAQPPDFEPPPLTGRDVALAGLRSGRFSGTEAAAALSALKPPTRTTAAPKAVTVPTGRDLYLMMPDGSMELVRKGTPGEPKLLKKAPWEQYGTNVDGTFVPLKEDKPATTSAPASSLSSQTADDVPTFNTVEEAEQANLPSGTVIMVGGRKARVK